MRKIRLILFSLLLLLITLALASCGDGGKAQIKSAKGFDLDQDELTLKTTVSNDTDTFSFVGVIKVSQDATWKVCTDSKGKNDLPTKKVDLRVGDNVCYILVTAKDEEDIQLYTVKIRRRPTYTVTFVTNGLPATLTQEVEEDGYIVAPAVTPVRAGYKFAGWNNDFSDPVIGSLTVNALWTADTDTAYTVEHYLQHKDDDGYDKVETENKTGETGATVTAEPKTYQHYVLSDGKSNVTGTIKRDGSLVLKLYYDVETHVVTFDGNGGSLSAGSATQKIKHGNAVAVYPTFTRKGYTLSGWDGADAGRSVTGDITITANWSLDVYTVTYDPNGGSAVNNPAQYSVTDNAPLASPTWEYGRFLGWYTANGTKVTNLQGQAGNLTLTARWECFYTASNGVITGVSDYCKANLTDLVVPATLEGKAVTAIGEKAFEYCSNVTSVTLPNSIVSIGTRAFAGCSNLTSVTLPNSVTGIGTYAFSSCRKLTSVSIPTSVKTIGEGAFASCSSLTSVTIPSGVTAIADKTFDHCTKLASVSIPSTVKTIGENAFSCTNLTSLTLPEGVTSIGFGAFSASKLKSISLPSTLKTIGDCAFSSNGSLTTITVASGNTVYKSSGNCLIHVSSKKLITGCKTSVIPDDGSVTTIDAYAFKYCTSLTSITIPNAVKTIPEGAFEGCKSLQSITLPFVGATSNQSPETTCNYPLGYIFGDVSYDGGTKVKQSYVERYSWDLAEKTYYLPSALRTVTVTGGFVCIGAFSNCSQLTAINICEGVLGIQRKAFDGCTGLHLNAYDNALYLASNGNPYAVLVKPSSSTITSCTVHPDTKLICESAFNGCASLASLTLPFVGSRAGVTSTDAFRYPLGFIFGYDSYTGGKSTYQHYYASNTSLYVSTTYYIPTSLKTVTVTGGNILSEAFYNCSNLTTVRVGEGVTQIQSSAFSGCYNLQYTSYGNALYLGTEENPYVALVKAEATSITSCTVHADTKLIADSAFYNCTSLDSITFQGTKAEWNAVVKGTNWNGGRDDLTVVCTDGTIPE